MDVKPECCGKPAKHIFTDSGGMHFYQCVNCRGFFHLGEGVLERMKRRAK